MSTLGEAGLSLGSKLFYTKGSYQNTFLVTLTPSGKWSRINLRFTDVSRMKTNRLKTPNEEERQDTQTASQLQDPDELHRRNLQTAHRCFAFPQLELLQCFTLFLWECSFKVLLPLAKFFKRHIRNNTPNFFSFFVTKQGACCPISRGVKKPKQMIVLKLLVVVLAITFKKVSRFREYFE